jgi:hypothetical protein
VIVGEYKSDQSGFIDGVHKKHLPGVNPATSWLTLDWRIGPEFTV